MADIESMVFWSRYYVNLSGKEKSILHGARATGCPYG